MIRVRRSAERGHFDHGWLDTYHTFSFGDYEDAEHMGYRTLRVINDDIVHAESGFGMHPHRDMEIITYVVDGQLAHRDSMNNGAVLGSGAFQVMTAGRGLMHSEFNPSNAPVRLLQIWIRPDARGRTPSYADRSPEQAGPAGAWDVVAAGGSPGGAVVENGAHADAVLPIHQDARVYHAVTPQGGVLTHTLGPGRGAWVQVVDGSIEVEGQTLARGDGAAIEDVAQFELRCSAGTDVLLFDLGA